MPCHHVRLRPTDSQRERDAALIAAVAKRTRRANAINIGEPGENTKAFQIKSGRPSHNTAIAVSHGSGHRPFNIACQVH